MGKAICILPNEALEHMVQKGAMRFGYYNPHNMFGEVHVLSPSARDVDSEAAQLLAGDAPLTLHSCNYNLRTCLVPNIRESTLEALLPIVQDIRPDIIRAYNPMVAGWLAVNLGIAIGVPAVVSVHTDYWRDQALADSFYQGRLARGLYYLYQDRVIAPFVLGHANAVICKYRFVAEWAESRGGRNIRVVYNRIDTDKFALGSRRYTPTRCPTVLTVGRLERIKNVELLIRAMAHCSATLRIVGDGSDRRRLERIANKMNLGGRVEFLGMVPNDKLPAVYRDSDMFASATYGGGVGVVMLEAMASGLPLVLVKNRWDSSRDVADAAAFIVGPNPAEIGSAIDSLGGDARARERLGCAGRKSILSLNSDEGDVYAELLT